jgi:hypothetical protein
MVDDLVIDPFFCLRGRVFRSPPPSSPSHHSLAISRLSQCPGLANLHRPRGFLSAGRWHVKVCFIFPRARPELWCDRADIDGSQNVPDGSENAISSPPVRGVGV